MHVPAAFPTAVWRWASGRVYVVTSSAVLAVHEKTGRLDAQAWQPGYAL
jgi:hypothetical protein